uniref:WD_REPEATS_REGION domain-containing protein n=1 Tax=Trichuris muris TaxID=70415 RepID=A0A5S6QXS6_TRIMR
MCISWNQLDDYIACGGDQGLLKVVKLSSSENLDSKASNTLSDISMDVNLKGHGGSVLVAVWNAKFQKLTTADSRGYIIVWALHNGNWYEEMINNRDKSTVNSVKWSSDGNKICIAYNDGMIIVGSVDGNKLWVTDLHQNVVAVEWSPYDKLILLGTTSGEIYVYDSMGNFQSKIKVPVALNQLENQQLVCIDWGKAMYNAEGPSYPRCLAIVYQQGYLQLLFNEKDKHPLTANLPIQVIVAKWNPDGTVLAVLAEKAELPNGERSMIYFINGYGEPIHTLKVPGIQARSCSWEKSGLCLAIAADSFIILASIKAEYKWTFFSNTVVYSFKRPDRRDTCVAFWDSKLNEVHIKHVHMLAFVDSCKDHALVLHSCEDDENKHYLEICNAVGNPVDFVAIAWKALFATVNSQCAIVADSDNFCLWYFTKVFTPGQEGSLGKLTTIRRQNRLMMCHIDDSSTGAAVASSGPVNKKTADPICCIHASDDLLLIARKSGQLYQYKFPALRLNKTSRLISRPTKMALNCSNTKMAYIDSSHVLRLFAMDGSEIGGFERRDVWDFKWSTIDQDLLAVSEKNKLVIFKGSDAQEPVCINARICELGNVKLRAIYLDDLTQHEEPTRNNYFVDIPTKLLSDAIDLVKAGNIASLQNYAKESQHPALWRCIAEEAFKRMDVELAELSFVQLLDYNGIQFLRTLVSITDPLLKKAEVYAYLGEIDKAEKQLIESDRIDLAIALHRRSGNWKRVLQLMKDNLGITNDVRLDYAYREMGDRWADQRQWKQAASFYKQGKCSEKLVTSYKMLEEYEKIGDLVDSLTDVDQLEEAAITLANAGLASEAEEVMKKWRDSKVLAEDQAVRWKQIALFIENIRQAIDIIQLHRRNHRYNQAAKILFELAKREDVQNAGPLLLKQIQVLGALLLEMHKRRQCKASSPSGSATKLSSSKTKMLNDFLLEQSDTANFYLTDNAWRGAEAYHYYMLSQRMLHQGDASTAMKIALLLCDFEDQVNPKEIYSLLGLTSCNCGHFSICSKAFIKLETLCNNEHDAEENPYETLAFSIFTQNGTKDPPDSGYLCTGCKGNIASYLTRCSNCDRSFPVCILTGKTLTDPQSIWTCKTCMHNADSAAMLDQTVCPLCHALTE